MTEKNLNPKQKMKNKDVNVARKSVPEIANAPNSESEKKEETSEKKGEEKKESSEVKKPIKGTNKPKVKKDFAIVDVKSLPISTKQAVSICKFVKGKKIERAIKDLETVIVGKKPIPMKGEYAHQKGKGISGAKFPKNASREFIKLLKSLNSNAIVNELDNPVVVEAIANMAYKPFGRRGWIRRKRTHVKLKAMEKKENSKKKINKKSSKIKGEK